MSTKDTASTGAKPTSLAKRKLGKGLGALMGEARREEPLVRSDGGPGGSGRATASAATRVTPAQGASGASAANMLAIAAIEPHPEQPRRHFDENALAELAASIESRGVIQPVIVRPLAGGRYQLVAGERRWRAAQKARLHEIPAIVRELDEQEVTALALIENVQREDLNPVEEARAYHRLSEQDGMTQAEIAKLVDKSRSHVANLQRLLALPDAVLDHVEAGRLDMGHARALIGHDDAAGLAEEAVRRKLSVRDVEKLARKGRSGGGEGRKTARQPQTGAEDADIAAVENHLEEILGLSVKIATDADPRSGSVTIKYRTLDQLDLVCQRLTGASI